MGERADTDKGPVGVNPQRSVLFAQVSGSDPRMAFDEEGTMHQFGTMGSFGKVYLGDVARAALRSLGTHDPPVFTEMPRVDEQRWRLECETEEIRMVISSWHYWGFGLFAKCFLNRIELTGPLELRARCVHDIISSMGRNPWEATRVRRFEKSTGGLVAEHGSSWLELERRAKDDMNEEILELDEAVKSLRGKEEGILSLIHISEPTRPY